MKWDAVERELVVVGAQLQALGRSFEVLALELHKERDAATHAGTEKTRVGRETNKGGPAAEPGLPF